MIRRFLGASIAIVGGGRACKAFLEFLTHEVFADQRPKILGVADINQAADGIRFARALGIPTFSHYTQLFRLNGLETLLELTNSPAIIETLRDTKPPTVKLIDHFEARAIRDFLMVEQVRIESYRELQQVQRRPEDVRDFLDRVMDRFTAIIERRNRRSREIEIELVGKERTLYQIIQGSTIPTFVINEEHVITHWNKAMEKLTRLSAEQAIGTTRQWFPFYDSPRPSMADVVLSQSDEAEIMRLYGTHWRKSALIEGGFEAEGFFPSLGDGGRWCWFTAAPIKSSEGRIVGAIETLWDKTEDKRADEERERHTAELSALVSVYSALNASADLDERIRAALAETQRLIGADGICLYLRTQDDSYHLRVSCGVSEKACRILPTADKHSAIYHAGSRQQFTEFEELPPGCTDEIRLIEEEKMQTLAYIPVISKEKQTFGVIRAASRMPQKFPDGLKNVLELIGNRIAVAIENAMLQEQVRKSEEKYRSVFNNDPNPIFIISPDTFQIQDTNQTAEDCYGYPKRELVGLPFFVLGEKGEADVRNGFQHLEKGQSILFSKKRQYKKGRQPFFVNINVSRAEYGGRDVLIATTTDITEAIEKEAQLIQAGKMTTLGVMAAGMAHEINQPLNVIQLSAEFIVKMLKRGQALEPAELKRVADDIIASVARATSVITHVRDFSRPAELARSRVNLNDPIRDVFKILGHQLKAHQIEIDLDLAADLPPILADHNRLEQVFVNLVSNAIDAIDEKNELPGDSADTARRIAIRSFSDGGRVVAEVTDTGVGMPEHVKNKLFEPFFTTKKVGKGTGLGTSISYGIVRGYDGTIDIESQPGHGATFRLTFPQAR
ncbi:MAG: ATP-binding protein [Hyphomicrobiales bacterium]